MEQMSHKSRGGKMRVRKERTKCRRGKGRGGIKKGKETLERRRGPREGMEEQDDKFHE